MKAEEVEAVMKVQEAEEEWKMTSEEDLEKN